MSLERLGVSAAMEAAVDDSPREPALCCSITTDRDVVAATAAAGAENPHNQAAAAAASPTEVALSLSSVTMGC